MRQGILIYFVGSLAFSSSGQFKTRTMLGA